MSTLVMLLSGCGGWHDGTKQTARPDESLESVEIDDESVALPQTQLVTCVPIGGGVSYFSWSGSDVMLPRRENQLCDIRERVRFDIELIVGHNSHSGLRPRFGVAASGSPSPAADRGHTPDYHVSPQSAARSFCRSLRQRAFGKPLFGFQHVRFELAECATLARVARVFVDDCVNKLISGELDTTIASMAKYWVTDTEGQIADRCLQMFGGYGYMTEFPIGCTQTPERNESTGEPTRS
jgi:hypothetical protein